MRRRRRRARGRGRGGEGRCPNGRGAHPRCWGALGGGGGGPRRPNRARRARPGADGVEDDSVSSGPPGSIPRTGRERRMRRSRWRLRLAPGKLQTAGNRWQRRRLRGDSTGRLWLLSIRKKRRDEEERGVRGSWAEPEVHLTSWGPSYMAPGRGRRRHGQAAWLQGGGEKKNKKPLSHF